jgi:hypothetical protein
LTHTHVFIRQETSDEKRKAVHSSIRLYGAEPNQRKDAAKEQPTAQHNRARTRTAYHLRITLSRFLFHPIPFAALARPPPRACSSRRTGQGLAKPPITSRRLHGGIYTPALRQGRLGFAVPAPPRCCVAGLLALREARCGCFDRGYDSRSQRMGYELWECGFGLRVLLLMGMEFIGWRERCLLGSSGWGERRWE